MSLHAETDVADNAETTSNATNAQNRFMICSCHGKRPDRWPGDSSRAHCVLHATDDGTAERLRSLSNKPVARRLYSARRMTFA
jgi:hypothetical protein